MFKFLIFLSIFFLVSNCSTPGTAFLGPVLTGAKSGSVYQASLSYGSNIALDNIKKDFRKKKENLKKTRSKISNKVNDFYNPPILLALKTHIIEISKVSEPEPLP
tara:strand:+ start:514 stop:828 length:315 start_codon:yes stop_codon:yes gene_type:complete